MAELRTVETYHGPDAIRSSIGRVVCSFASDARREGTMIECVDGKVSTCDGQPDLNLYPGREQKYMKRATAIVYMLIYSSDHHNKPKYHKV